MTRMSRSMVAISPPTDATTACGIWRTMDIGPQAAPLQLASDEAVAPPPSGTVRWIDLQGQDDATLAVLKERFDLHPLAIEDCSHFDQRPKLEEYGTYLFVVVHGFVRGTGPVDVEPIELHAFLGRDFLITVHSRPFADLDKVWKRMTGDAALARRGADFIYYTLVDALVDSNFIILDSLSEELDEIEDEVLQQHQSTHLSRIFTLKKTLVSMRRVLSPQRDVFAILSKRGHPCITERTSLYFRDVYDHLVRIYESIDTGRDLLGNALDAYLSMVAQRTNEIMKKLGVMSAIFLPLTFVTGFFGQNFTHLPFDNDFLLATALASCVAIPFAMLMWFRRTKWL